jgi:hypothetical protein
MKFKKKITRPTPKGQDLIALEQRVTELYGDIAKAELRVEHIGEEVEREVRTRIRAFLQEGNDYYIELERQLMAKILEFMQHAPVWEVHAVDRTLNPLGGANEIKKLYSQGWRYLMTTYEQQQKLELFHRPVLPQSEEEWMEIYRNFMRKRRKDSEFAASLRQVPKAATTLTLPAPPPLKVRKKRKVTNHK